MVPRPAYRGPAYRDGPVAAAYSWAAADALSFAAEAEQSHDLADFDRALDAHASAGEVLRKARANAVLHQAVRS